MERFIKTAKEFNKNYKYFVLALVAVATLTLFTGAANQPAQATETRANSATKETPAVVSNVDKNSEEFKKLENQINGEKTTAQATPEPTPTTTPPATVAPVTSIQQTPGYQGAAGYVQVIAQVLGDTLVGGNLGSTEASAAASVVLEHEDYPGQYIYLNVGSGGGIKSIFQVINAMYIQSPASAEIWAADISQRASISANAQDTSATYNPGRGYELLSPVYNLWRATSNAVYIFYILIIVAIAFLIVFRAQLDGQNAINLYQAIPSLVISLILVYFSYPLSAVFIDLVTVGSGVVYGTLIGTTAAEDGGTAPGAFLLDKDYRLVTYYPQNVGNLVPGPVDVNPRTELQINDKPVSIWQVFSTAGVNPTADGVNALVPKDIPFADLISNAISGVQPFVGSVLSLVFIFAAFSASLKLFFSLLREYVVLMIYPVMAPFMFLFAAIPNQTNQIVGNYFRRLLAASMSFVGVYAVLLATIIISRGGAGIGDLLWVPPMLGYDSGNLNALTGAKITSIARPLLAYALFVSAPLVPDMLQQLLAQPGQSPITENIRQATQQGARSALATIGGANNFITGALGIQPKGK